MVRGKTETDKIILAQLISSESLEERIKPEEKAKVVAVVCGTYLNAALTIYQQG